MISILHRYIAKTVITSTFIIIGVVLAIAYFVGFLGELKDIGSGDYGIAQAALHSLLELPHSLYQFFPMLVLLGGLMGLGMLSSNQELVVMRISGTPVLKILRAVFGAAVVLIIFGLFIGEFISPKAHYLANKHKSMAESSGQAVATMAGVWLHEGNNFYHFDHVIARQHLEGVTRYEFDNQHRLIASYYAKTMDFRQGSWVLRDLAKTTFLTDRTIHEEMPTATWNVALNPNFLNVGSIEPDEIPLNKLSQFTRHLVKNGLQASEFQFQFWRRIFQPLTILVMLFLAVPFVFAAPRSVTMGWRMLLGVAVGFIFYILDALLGQISIVFQISPIAAALFPILLFALLGYALMAKLR